MFTQPFIQTQIIENFKDPRHWPLCGTGEFPAQMASNAENVSIWWRHHARPLRQSNDMQHDVVSQPLTLNVRGASYLGLTRSISRLLMLWLLTSPGHQQPWYWLCRIGRFLSYLRKDFNYLRRINVEKDTKGKYMFMFPLKNLARKGLNLWCWKRVWKSTP